MVTQQVLCTDSFWFRSRMEQYCRMCLSLYKKSNLISDGLWKYAHI
uniref:Uncharacterized protein n=1 Tax=Arundo donax TaxID=35708 RepID=A0A0A9HBI3_ARUDO